MKWPNFENPLGSHSNAEMADIEEACLRGELPREDFETLKNLLKKDENETKGFNDET